MKFTNGYWMDRAGYAVRKARGLRDLAVEDDGAVVVGRQGAGGGAADQGVGAESRPDPLEGVDAFVDQAAQALREGAPGGHGPPAAGGREGPPVGQRRPVDR